MLRFSEKQLVGKVSRGIHAREASDQARTIQLARHIQQHYGHEVRLFLITPTTAHTQAQPSIDATTDKGIEILLDPQGTLHQRLGAQMTTLYLLRPDGYVGYRSQPAQIEHFEHYMHGVLGIQSAVMEQL